MSNDDTKRTPRERWVVSYIDGDGSDDWQLIRNHRKEYFGTEEFAKEFMKGIKQQFKKKPFYWQPSMWKETSFEITTTHWRSEK